MSFFPRTRLAETMSTTKTPPRQPSRAIKHEFVEFIPDALAPDTLYISIEFTTAVHSCFCGCGSKVVTPIRPTSWQLLFDGDAVSLWPSIGNWNFRCRSHYWIRGDRVIWALPMTQREIEHGRSRDRQLIDDYFDESSKESSATEDENRKSHSLHDWIFKRHKD
jgi:hypothetical protein